MSWFRDIFNRIRRPLYISTGALGADSTRKLSDYTTELEKFGDTLNPSFPLEFIPLIKRMALIYPDVSQAVKRSVLLGNTGLKFRLEGASDQVQEQAQLEIKNWLAEYPGIINKLFRQVVMTGAVSCEGIPSIDLKSVEELRLIPVEQIRFKREWLDDVRYSLVACQLLPDGRLQELNTEQFHYEAIETEEDSPYGIPPFISMLRHLFLQAGATDNVRNLLDRLGLMGFIDVSKKAPSPNAGEDQNAYQNRLMSILTELRNNIADKLKSGVLVHYNDTTTTHTNVTGDMRGYEQVYRSIEEQTASGLDIDPALLGRNYSTTETYAGVVFAAFLAKLGNLGQPVENAMKKFLTLHLRARGFKFDRLHAEWGDPVSMDKQADANAKKARAEAEEIKLRLTLAKVQAGLIEPDEAATELGYDSWANPEHLTTSNTESQAGLGQQPGSNILPFVRPEGVKKKSVTVTG